MQKKTARRKRDYLFIKLLKAFTKMELEGFKHFVACRYFNTDQFAIKLLYALVESAIHKEDFTIALQIKVFKKVFPKKEKPDKELNDKQKSFLAAKMNVLLGLAKTFLCNEGLKKNDACKNELLLDSLIEKKQDELFNRVLRKEKNKIQEKYSQDFEDYENEYKLEAGQFKFLTNNSFLLKKDNLQEYNKCVDINYIISKLEIHSLAKAIAKVSARKYYHFDIMPTLDFLLDQKKYDKHPFVNLQLISIELQTKNSEEVYRKFILQLDKNAQFVSRNILEKFYTIAGNFCTKQIIKGKKEYYQEMFTLYKKRDEKGLLINNENIDIGILKNLVTLSCKVEAFDWATQMIEKHISFVKKEYRESVYHFNIGTIAFYQNDFNLALHHFIRVDNINLVYNINCKMMIFKSHYLLDREYDERTLRIFLISERYIMNQKTMGANNKKAYKNFVRILINIYKYKHRAGKTTKENIINKLQKMEFISDKKWLLQMIEDQPIQ